MDSLSNEPERRSGYHTAQGQAGFSTVSTVSSGRFALSCITRRLTVHNPMETRISVLAA